MRIISVCAARGSLAACGSSVGAVRRAAVVRQRFCLILRRCAVGQVVEKVALFTFVWACHAESPRR